MQGLSLVAASRGHSSSRCAGLSLLRPLLLRSTSSRRTGRLSSCGSRAQMLHGMWDLPRPGLEPASPALAGRFSTLRHQGSPSLPVWILLSTHGLSCPASWRDLIHQKVERMTNSWGDGFTGPGKDTTHPKIQHSPNPFTVTHEFPEESVGAFDSCHPHTGLRGHIRAAVHIPRASQAGGERTLVSR